MGEQLEPTISLSPSVTLDSYGVHSTLEELKDLRDVAARILAARIRKDWRFRGNRSYITLRLTSNELDLIRQAGGTPGPNGLVYNYVAIYRHPATGTEVKLRSADRPPKKRSFKLPMKGRKRFVRVRLFRVNTNKESTEMPKKSTKKKKDEEDELEGLEELEELDDEEPEDDDEDSDEEDDDEEEAPPKRKRKSKSKKSSKKKSTAKKSKKSKSDEDEEDEDEDDDDEEEEKPKKSKKGKKSSSKKSSKKGGKKSGGNSNLGRTTKELTGGVGSAELAAAASEIAEVEITGRDVRVYLRKNEIPLDEEHGRYVWPSVKNKGFLKLAKAIAAEYEED